MNRIKLFIIKILRFVLKFFYIFPVKQNTFLFSAYEGRQFSDNPKYLYLYIKEKFGDKYKYVWVLNEKQNNLKTVKFLSFRHIFYLMTSKYIVSNLGIEPFVPKRKSQIFINTWHGSGAYKCQTLNEKQLKDKYTVNCRDYRAKKTDYYVSGCKVYSDISAESWNTSLDKFIPTGTPRNDVLFSNNKNEIRDKVLSSIGCNLDCRYLLYAPTFRGSSFRNHEARNFDIDFKNIIDILEKKYGKKYKVLFREHVGANYSNLQSDGLIIDVTKYPDMQELMIASDLMITDYSSCMWDFSLLNRPGFLYVPDLNDYKSQRDFYTSIETWPFAYAETQKDLEHLIENYDSETGIAKIKNHLDSLGSYEKGTASEQIVHLLNLK